MFPVFLDLSERLIVVIGGGPVGRRKARAVLAAGGRVRLVCLEARPDSLNDSLLDWRTEAYSPNHLDGAALVFAAGPTELNARVTTDARARNIWVNAASQPRSGDFLVPATVRRGDFAVAISTGGAAPLLSQTVRQRLEQEFDTTFADWVSLLAELRQQVMERIADTGQRRRLLTSLCQWQWLERLRNEDRDTVRVAMFSMVDAIVDRAAD